nr:DUF3348 family protein [Lysobacter ruishenii]
MHNALRGPAPALHRLLARLGEVEAAPAAPSLTAQLSQWLEWTHAVALSSALDARPAAPTADATATLSFDGSECARVRAALVTVIVGDRAFASPQDAAAPSAAGNTDTPSPDATFFRQRHAALQQVMDADISHLRGRLRGLLTQQAPELAQLAAMDAVMERALGRQERALLSTLPEWLCRHFDRLHLAAAAAPDAISPSARWLDVFRQDMQSLLLAELDLRLQPSEGLVAALRSTVTA